MPASNRLHNKQKRSCSLLKIAFLLLCPPTPHELHADSANGAPTLSALSESNAEEEEGSPASQKPLWRRPPAHCQWEIQFRHLQLPALEQKSNEEVLRRRLPLRVRVTKHGRDTLQETLLADGTTLEAWNLKSMEIHSVTDKDDVWLHPRRSRPLTSPHFETKPAKTSHLSTSEIQESSHHSHAYEKDDWRSFIEFSWVRSEHLHATHPIDGEQALVYLHPLQDRSTEFLATLHKAPKGELGLPLVEGVIAAAISPGTRLPKMLQVGAEVRVYTFNPLPQQALALPTKVERFVKMLLSPAKFSPRPLP